MTNREVSPEGEDELLNKASTTKGSLFVETHPGCRRAVKDLSVVCPGRLNKFDSEQDQVE